MAKKTTTTQTLELTSISPKTVTVTIVGDSDLILNKMNDTTRKTLTDQRKKCMGTDYHIFTLA